MKKKPIKSPVNKFVLVCLLYQTKVKVFNKCYKRSCKTVFFICINNIFSSQCKIGVDIEKCFCTYRDLTQNLIITFVFLWHTIL